MRRMYFVGQSSVGPNSVVPNSVVPRLFLLLFCLLFVSCASKPLFKGKGDLCGLVIDENNRPVKDFVVNCKPAEIKLHSKIVIPPVLTNESGLFVFYGLPSGDYFVSGQKKNYLKISKTKYSFNDRGKILCLQTKGFRAVVLQAEDQIRLGQTEEALSLLRGIACETDSRVDIFIRDFTAELEEVVK